jgi:hypothetical protein
VNAWSPNQMEDIVVLSVPIIFIVIVRFLRSL